MDINLIRIGVTVVSFFIFIVICWWAWGQPNQKRFQEASELPLEDDFAASNTNCGSQGHV